MFYIIFCHLGLTIADGFQKLALFKEETVFDNIIIGWYFSFVILYLLEVFVCLDSERNDFVS